MKTAKFCMWMVALCMTLGLLRRARPMPRKQLRLDLLRRPIRSRAILARRKHRKRRALQRQVRHRLVPPRLLQVLMPAQPRARNRKRKKLMIRVPQLRQTQSQPALQPLDPAPTPLPQRAKSRARKRVLKPAQQPLPQPLPLHLQAQQPRARRRNLQQRPLRHKPRLNREWYGSTPTHACTTRAANGTATRKTASG